MAAGDCGRIVCNTHSAPFGVAAFCGRRVCVRVRAHGIHRVCCRWLTVIRSVVSVNCVSLENILELSGAQGPSCFVVLLGSVFDSFVDQLFEALAV